MIRKKNFKILFSKTKYIVYKLKTEDNIYYDVLFYKKKGLFWINEKNVVNNVNFDYLRFNDIDDVIKYIIKCEKRMLL